ncbi:MAG TPA: DUF4331 domain-containing protein [Thermoanaerobaculia bacterium]|nr:DUF4331 domain-containing protein [Thermoanaerobaculia bacterium]
MNGLRLRNAPTLALAALLLTLSTSVASASSHREAPGISNDPLADNTDVYFFRDPADPSRLVLISNWVPLEEPAGGPNFFHFGENIRYEFNVDSNGDGLEEIVYRVEFTRHIRSGNTFLQNTGAVASPTDANQNVYYTYTVKKCLGPSPNQPGCTLLGSDLLEAPNNPGPKSFPNGYATGSGIQSLSYPIDDDTVVFAGPRAEGFYVDLGMIFDLVNFRPGTLPGNHGGGTNSTAGYNVHSIALSVPIGKLTANGSAPTDTADPNAVVSMWSSTWRRNAGGWYQVSRLGNPLINEVVIPLGMKDAFNATYPVDDLANFGTFVLNPELPGVLHALFGISVPPTPRNDLLILVQGVPGLTRRPNEVVSDQLRLNVAVPPTPPSSADRLGVIAGDNAGYPNGRRVADDTVDIALRVVAGVLVDGFNVSPNNALGDGVDGPDVPYLASFPYLAAPHSGFDRIHANSAQLQGGRFSATVSWTDPNGGAGSGTPVGVAGNTQGFWFFSPDNIELTVKVLDGRDLNGHFWVFYGSLTDVAFTLTVTDNTTGATKTYTNPQGTNGSAADTSAF